jgi:predicted phosphodiesterase
LALLTAVVYSDTHIPFQDDRAVALVKDIVRDVDPDILIHGGDLADCFSISKYLKDPARRSDLRTEAYLAHEHLADMASIKRRRHKPARRLFYLEGNHERRVKKVLFSMTEQARELAGFPEVQALLRWEALAKVGETGFSYIQTEKQTKTYILPKWITKHGTVVRKYSGYSARAEWEKYGRSGSSGHTHRLGAYFHRDHNGNHLWMETGCTCSLEPDPDLCVDPDWQQGCVIVTFNDKTGAFAPEIVYHHEGSAIYRGELWEAA